MVAAVRKSQGQAVTVPAAVTIPANMTAAWFDAAVARSFDKDLAVKALGNGRYAMVSSRDASVTYIVTRESCGCQGFQHYHKCYHVARAAFEDSFTGPEPSAPATVPACGPLSMRHLGLSDGSHFLTYAGGAWRHVAADGTVLSASGPIISDDCLACDGFGCDASGTACAHCEGTGTVTRAARSVADIIAAGAWPHGKEAAPAAIAA